MAIDTYPKQPAEIRYYDVSYTKLLRANGDSPAAITPYEIVMPAGLTLVASSLTANNVIKMLISGGTNGVKYKITTFLNTVGNQRIEHEILIAVKET